MKREIEMALQNIDLVCSSAQLNRNQHAELARNVKLVHDALIESDKPKGKKKDADAETDV